MYAVSKKSDAGAVGGPPPLPFSIREHKLSITIFWTLIAAEVCFIPVSFYYGLWFGTHLDHGALFAIITSVFGFVSGVEYARRGWRLLRRDPQYRPLGGYRWGLDATHVILSAPYTVMTGVLIGFSIPREPIVWGLALPFALGDVILGLFFLLSAFAHKHSWHAPVPISSLAKGEVCIPLAFTVLEDIIAVDAGGGIEFREAARARWLASPKFRSLLVGITRFWGWSTLAVGVAVIAVVLTVDQAIGYGIGWAVPSAHAALGALITGLWARQALRDEKRSWNDSHTPTNSEELKDGVKCKSFTTNSIL